jgi:GNAT superfamily N-acetyltransferase
LTDESPAQFEVRRVKADQLLDLRRRVLRADNPESSVEDVRDAQDDALHFGGFLGDRLVASASWFISDPPVNEELRSYQLRYMAIDYDVQGHGYGATVLTVAIAELQARGAEQLWANARDSALGFYLTTGWTAVEGSQHISKETQLPHTAIFRLLTSA